MKILLILNHIPHTHDQHVPYDWTSTKNGKERHMVPLNDTLAHIIYFGNKTYTISCRIALVSYQNVR